MTGERTIVLTGASGLIGQALLEVLDGHVICLSHQAEIPAYSNGEVVHEPLRCDIRQPRYGLSKRAFDELARRADAIIHCAALTDYTSTEEQAFAANVDGVRNTLELVASAEAPLYHLSTAFVAAKAPELAAEQRRIGPQAYVASKRAGEAAVRDSGLDAMIIRPSIVIGDSRTGRVARFQGIHVLVRFFFEDRLAMVPVDPASHIDFVPQDLVAASVAALVNAGERGGEWWVTAGTRALTAREMLESGSDFARASGRDVTSPRLVAPDVVDRLIRPVFLPELPRRAQRRFEQLHQLVSLFFLDNVFPSSLDELSARFDVDTDLDLVSAMNVSARYWAESKGYL